jgi:hypothetical protein
LAREADGDVVVHGGDDGDPSAELTQHLTEGSRIDLRRHD